MQKVRKLPLTIGIFAALLALAGPAVADTTVQLTVGPVAIPNAPVELCVNQDDVPVGDCVETPPAQSVTLTVIVSVDTPEPVVNPPTITPIACPAGTEGVAVEVFTGSAGATISGFITIVVNGTPTTIPVNEVVAGAGQTVTIFACAGVSPGVPVPTVPSL